MSCEYLSSGFETGSDTNRAVQPQKMATGVKFLIRKQTDCTINVGKTKAQTHMSRVIRKPAFCMCANKDADQLRGNREADQRLCFHYIDSTIPILPKSEFSNL